VLADTTYNSLSVDEVAASHVEADCVVHYGRASLTKLSRIPAYYVFPSRELNVDAVADALAESDFLTQKNNETNDTSATATTSPSSSIIFLDQVLLDNLSALETAIREKLPTDVGNTLEFAKVPSRSAEPATLKKETTGCCKTDKDGNGENKTCSSNHSGISAAALEDTTIAGYTWNTSIIATTPLHQCRFVWIGSLDAPARTHLQLTYSTASWLTLDPFASSDSLKLETGLPIEVSRLLKRRYFLVEKARNANIIGLLVGTLGVAGYGDALRQLRKAAQRADKKTYTMLMGKPSPAKLANFPEVDVFVLVADPQGQILDSKEYLAPIITPHEAMLAFTEESEWKESEYRLDFDHILSNTADKEGNFSDKAEEEGGFEEEALGALTVQAQKALIVTPAAAGAGHLVEIKSAADYLAHKRTWTGVETPLVGSEKKEAHVAVPGQSGRAAGYSHEEIS
jgi:diphthamide biosynthesis protein 2